VALRHPCLLMLATCAPRLAVVCGSNCVWQHRQLSKAGVWAAHYPLRHVLAHLSTALFGPEAPSPTAPQLFHTVHQGWQCCSNEIVCGNTDS